MDAFTANFFFFISARKHWVTVYNSQASSFGHGHAMAADFQINLSFPFPSFPFLSLPFPSFLFLPFLSLPVTSLPFLSLPGPFFPECVARVPVSLWGSGGWGCVRSTLPNRPQPSQPSTRLLYGVSSPEGVMLDVSNVALLRFAWQAWHFVTFRRVL